MATVNVELPSDLVVAARQDQGNVSEEAVKLIALDLFRERTFSLGRAAELCAENYAESLAHSSVHRVVCDYIAGMTDGYFERCYQQALG
jgi:dGTP triphosphohydrolase